MLNSRRVDKLRRDLSYVVGATNISKIDGVLPKADQLFSQGMGYQDVLNQLQDEITCGVQAPQHPLSTDPYRPARSPGRVIPVHPKIQHEDEWGAVAIQQAEAQRLQDEMKRHQEIEKRQAYRYELDRQAHDAVRLKQQEQSKGQYSDADLVQAQIDQEKEQSKRFQNELAARYQMRRDFDNENIRNKMMTDATKQNQIRSENQTYMQQLTADQEAEQARQRNQQVFLKRMNEDTKSFNQMQVELKRQQLEEQKRYDLQNFPKTSLETQDSYEQRRQRFLKDFQNYHSQVLGSQEIVSGFQRYNNSYLNASKEDEKRQQQDMQRQEEQYQKKISWEQKRREMAKQEMISALNEQVRQKNSKAMQEIQEDRSFGQQALQQSAAEVAREEQDLQRRRAAMKSYSSELVNQIKQSQEMRKKSHAMSDHEKRMNMAELKNFLSGNASTASNLPGMQHNHTVGNINTRASYNRDSSPYQFEKPINMTQLKTQATQRSRSTTPYKDFKRYLAEKNSSQRHISPVQPVSTFSRNAARILE